MTTVTWPLPSTLPSRILSQDHFTHKAFLRLLLSDPSRDKILQLILFSLNRHFKYCPYVIWLDNKIRQMKRNSPFLSPIMHLQISILFEGRSICTLVERRSKAGLDIDEGRPWEERVRENLSYIGNWLSWFKNGLNESLANEIWNRLEVKMSIGGLWIKGWTLRIIWLRSTPFLFRKRMSEKE